MGQLGTKVPWGDTQRPLPRPCPSPARARGAAAHRPGCTAMPRTPKPCTSCAVPILCGVSLVPLGGPSAGPGPARDGSQGHWRRLDKDVPGPTVKFRLELPFVFPSPPVPPAPSLVSAGSKPGPGAAQTHLSCRCVGASWGRGARGGGGSHDSAPPPTPLEAAPKWRARWCGATCQRGGP